MNKTIRRTAIITALVAGANAALSLFNTAQAATVTQAGYCGQTCNCSSDSNCNFNGAACICWIQLACSTDAGCWDTRQS